MDKICRYGHVHIGQGIIAYEMYSHSSNMETLLPMDLLPIYFK